MNGKFSAGLLVAFLILSLHAFAAEDRLLIARSKKPPSPLDKFDTLKIDDFDCRNAATAVQEIACGKNGLIQSNIDIEKAIQALNKNLDKRDRSYLAKSQESWRVSRNEFCKMDANGSQGAKATTSFMICVTEMNRERQQFLRRQLALKKK